MRSDPPGQRSSSSSVGRGADAPVMVRVCPVLESVRLTSDAWPIGVLAALSAYAHEVFGPADTVAPWLDLPQLVLAAASGATVTANPAATTNDITEIPSVRLIIRCIMLGPFWK